MKIKKTLLFLFVFVTMLAKAENISTSLHQIQWTGIDVWNTDKASKSVIAFDGATYPEQSLPHFTKRINCERNAQYNVSIVNPVFVPMTDEKEIALTRGIQFSDKVEIKTFKLSERNNYFLDIQVLPFVLKENKILKIKQFELRIEKLPTPAKAPEATSHTYANTSVLASGKFVKVKITESGIYKLTYENLNSMGIDPSNVRVFGYGGAMLEESFQKPKKDDLPEVAIYMNKGADGVFNAGDYILFYAQGVNSWRYDVNRKMFTHTLNPYSNEGYYFITSDAGIGKKIATTTVAVPEGATTTNVNEFVDYQVHEKEKYKLVNSGRVFYGEMFNGDLMSITYNFPFLFPNIVNTNSSVKIRVDVAATSTNVSNFTVKLNDDQPQNIYISATSNYYEQGIGSNIYFAYTPNSDNLMVNLTYNKGNTSSVGYLNYIEVNTRRSLKMSGSAMFFRNVDNLNKPVYNKYQLSNVNDNIQIWDVTDPNDVKRMETTLTDGVMEFVDSNESVKQYVAIDPTVSSAFTQPTSVGVVANQNLHGMPPSDFLIITHPRFINQANSLADAHRTKDNMKVNVVTTEQVYNEFSSGTPDATAYRWVTKMLYDRGLSSGQAPKYLLLFGRGSFDNKGLISTSKESLVLTYQSENSLHMIDSYVTDDYFGLLDDSESVDVKKELMDVGVGRFPVLTEQQATDVVNKTISYMDNKTKGIWKNQFCFVGDDGGDNNGNIHMWQADSVARLVFNINKGFQINKIYLDSYKQETSASGDTYPLAKTKLNSLIHSGLFLLNYTGHAGASGWTNEQILTTADIKQLYNEQLPFWLAATCDFVVMDDKDVSAGEYVVLNPVGGGIGIFAAARTVYSANNFSLNLAFSKHLFTPLNSNGLYGRLGDAQKDSKNELGSTGDSNKLSYVLLADPALKLTYPAEYKVITSKINERPITNSDTIKALSVNSVEGYIGDRNKNIVSDYNGTVEVTIYDKIQKITTLNNHNESNGVLVYEDRPNIIYSGKANVKDGKFTFSFMVPKDIKYNYGNGRINYYASEPNSNREAQDYSEDFKIGGTFLNYDKTDTIGPEITMYLNHSDFKSGGKTNETPVFFANLSDKNGINTVGSGIGHDLRLVIDDDPYTSFSLNDFFTATTNSYTSGSVQYKLSALPEGKHTLTFHAWDLLNNSSLAQLNFEVVKGLQPVIFGVSCYPNPAKSATTFVINHDRPQTVLETTVDVFDLVGRKIWSKTQSTVQGLTWNLTDFFGKRIQKGIYLYKVSIRTQNSTETSKANKIIVFDQQ